MNALKYYVEADEDGNIDIHIPEGRNKKFEVIVLQSEVNNHEYSNNAAYERMRLQEQTGYVKNIIGSDEEDVWNELI